jgi:hypothetical protein
MFSVASILESLLVSAGTYIIGHPDLVKGFIADVAHLFGKHYAAGETPEATKALQEGIAHASAAVIKAVNDREAAVKAQSADPTNLGG